MGFHVVTWNVLHRIHAVNWDEPVIKRWPVEGERIGSIADFLAATDADVICLQEVSGDQLAMLRDVERGEIFAMRYPRVPSYYRRFEPPMLKDPAEYLVTIVRDSGARQVTAAAFPSDSGKGFQRVELASGVTFVCTHVTYGDKRSAQLAQVVDDAKGTRMATVICGDFNADRDTIAAGLGAAFAPAIPRAPALPTRPRPTPGEKSEDIDHVFVSRGKALDAQVLDAEGRSDHNPVRVTLRLSMF